MKVVITGGHLTPALAVIDELRKKDVDIHFIGRLYAMEGDTHPSIESRTITEAGIPFYPLTTGRIQRRFTLHTIPSLSRIPRGFWQAYRYLRHIRPDVVLSFGGYLAVPVVVTAKLLGIPVVTHEQTVVFGLANKAISRFADVIAVSWEQSLAHFPAHKAVLTGNPIRKDLTRIKRRVQSRPLLYVTGGNQGAHIINQAVFDVLPELLEMVDIVHQTGTSKNTEDFHKAKALVAELPKNLAKHYTFKEWFSTEELARVLSKATLVVSRSGANTITELSALGIPSILIPIPWVAQDEQTKNATMLSERKMAIILRQKELTSRKLFTTIQFALEHINELEKHAKQSKKAFKTNAAEQLAELVFQVAPSAS